MWLHAGDIGAAAKEHVRSTGGTTACRRRLRRVAHKMDVVGFVFEQDRVHGIG